MSEPPPAKTIRLYCDGELPEQEAARFEQALQRDPHLKALVEFERHLREHAGAVLRDECPSAPSGLAERVRAGLAGADAGQSADDDARRAVAGRIGEAPGTRPARRRWWSGPHRANVFAVAASLALVAGAVLFGIFGRPIDDWTRPSADVAATAAAAAAAAAGEHLEMRANPAVVLSHLTYRTPGDARQGLAPYLGRHATVFDLSDLGYEFLGGGTCDLPQCERGCHLFYARTGQRPGLVTLHIVPNGPESGAEGTPFPKKLPLPTDIILPKDPACRKDVLVWTYKGFSFLLVVCLDEDVEKVAKRIQQTLLAPGQVPSG
jgi:anti-sigma factor RsiW